MKFNRVFTQFNQIKTDAEIGFYQNIEFEKRSSEIRNPDGTIVFSQDNIEVPCHWSQVATDILVQKYFRKAGIPAILKPVREQGVPSWLWCHKADEGELKKRPESERYVGEVSAKQVFHRLAGTWTYWGWKGGYFSSQDDAKIYYDEMCYMLTMQMAAPNSPQWFNTGLHWAYGIDGPGQGHYYVDYKSKKTNQVKQCL